MSESLLKALQQERKVELYILPIMGFNKSQFNGFVEAQICSDLSMVRITWSHGQHHLVIPEQWKADIRRIMDGKYSEISDSAKTMIRTYSGLAYKQTDHDGYELFTDYRLMVLDRDPFLRRQLEDELGATIPDKMELMDPPRHHEFFGLREA